MRLIPIDTDLAAALDEGPAAFAEATGATFEVASLVRGGIVQTLDAGFAPPWGGYLAEAGGVVVGTCAFKGRPNAEGTVEIAYFTFPAFEGRGHGTAMARALIALAETAPGPPRVVAHTRPNANASTRILERVGFRFDGPFLDPEDGPVWRWSLPAISRTPVTLHDGLREDERAAAAGLYAEAFGPKLGPILGDRMEGILARTFHLDRALVARQDGALVGLAGVNHHGQSLVGIDWAAMRRTYGWVSGGARLLVLALFDRTPEPGELVMDGLAVAAGARGQGIGTALLRGVLARAATLGMDRVRLDVVDANPGARRLYEREGFEAVRTESVPWLRHWMGFGASTTMVKRLSSV